MNDNNIKSYHKHYDTLFPTIRIIDVIAVISGSLLPCLFLQNSIIFSIEYKYAILLGSIFSAIIFSYNGLYISWRGRSVFFQIRVVTISWISVIFLLIATSIIFKNSAHYSRLWLVSWVITTWIILVTTRIFVAKILRRMRKHGKNGKNIVLFGAGAVGKMVYRQLKNAPESGYNVVAFFDDSSSLLNTDVDGITIKDGKENLDKFIQNNNILELWLTLPLSASERVKKILFDLRHSTTLIRYVPDIFGFQLLNHSISTVEGIPLLDFNRTPIFGVNRLLKEIEDRALSLIICILISPLMFIIGILIKFESKGPIIFKQIRHGKDGKPIKIYKFRSMKIHQEKNGLVTQAKKSDDRITNVGKFLRRTSLDELPQFINVLQGRMSIVGPRPHAIAHNEQFKDQILLYMQRHKVKPGITGWAQVNGWRGETDTLYKMEKRIEYDIFYIENWSILFDFYIILLTIIKGFIGKNAY